MLHIKPQIKSDDVVVIRLATGEEIIGRLESQTDVIVALKKPLALQVVQTQNRGEMGLTFAPFMMAPDENTVLEFQAKNLACLPVGVRDDIRNGYLKYTTGIEIVPAGASSLLRP